MVFPENWGKMTFYILLLGLPYLLLAQLISLVLVARFQIQTSYLADAIFIALFLIGPVSLISGSFYHAANATFSFAVTEGLVIDDNVVTELGKKYFFMQKMQDVFHMTIYIILRFLGGATLFGGIFKLTSS